MQAIEAYIERHLDAAQDCRLDIVEGYLETGDGFGIHAATLRRSISAAQCHGNSAAKLVIV
jgi:hypothetical protein